MSTVGQILSVQEMDELQDIMDKTIMDVFNEYYSKPDIIDVDSIRISLMSDSVHLSTNHQTSLLRVSEVYFIPFYYRLFAMDVNKFVIKCVFRFRKKIEKENEMIVREFALNKAMEICNKERMIN